MFGIGEKDSEGRQKRIEHRGRHLRVSRTGGVAVREQINVAGLNLTANSKHGVRATTRIAKGTNAGFQNGNFHTRLQEFLPEDYAALNRVKLKSE
jgi:hypothetical protein